MSDEAFLILAIVISAILLILLGVAIGTIIKKD